MPKRARKHSNTNTQSSSFSKGLNLSTYPANINDEEVTRAYNVWYETVGTGLINRYGLELATPSTMSISMTGGSNPVAPISDLPLPRLDQAISKVFYHVDNSGNEHLLVATTSQQGAGQQDKLYEVQGSEYVLVTNLETTGGQAPSLLSFNGYLMIADGSADGLKAWNGTDLQTIQGSPTYPTVLHTTADRVVCNSLTSPDSVFFSEPEQHTKWEVVEGGSAAIIPAGFGDGMEINAFATLYGMLIVSKVHKDETGKITAKKLHMISTIGVPSSWSGLPLSHTSASATADGMLGVLDKIFLLDQDGTQLIQPSYAGAYGDLSIDVKETPKILPLISSALRDLKHSQVIFLSSLAQVWFTLRTTGTVKTMVYSLTKQAWTELEFPLLYRSVCEVGDKVFIGGEDGRLYFLSAKGTDWTPKGEEPIHTTVRTKLYQQMGGDIILKGVKLSVGRITPSLIKIEAVDEDELRYTVQEVNTEQTGSADQKIFDANQKISNADWKIYGGNEIVKQYFDYKANVRKAGLYLQVRTVGGRVIINSINGLFANVG